MKDLNYSIHLCHVSRPSCVSSADSKIPKKKECPCGRSPTGRCCGWHNPIRSRLQNEIRGILRRCINLKT